MKKLPSLFENNRNWAEQIKEEHPDFFQDLSRGQKPEYLWVGCSDSRVPATEIVDLAPGDLFVHRNIANQIVHSDLNSQSVIQYAVSVLKVKHIIICGHYGCGGVKASMQEERLGLIDNWLLHIKDTYRKYEVELSGIKGESEKVNRLCELNVRAQVEKVCYNPFVQQAWNDGQSLTVHGWIYNLEDGLLKNLDICISSLKEAEESF